jgi:hypothetical protein
VNPTDPGPAPPPKKSLSRFVDSLREAQQEARRAWDPAKILSPWQYKFFADKSESKVADAGRGSGKTFVFAVELLDLCLSRPGARTAFCAKSETDARELILPDLLAINTEYQLGGEITKSTVKFPNGSFIRVMGTKDQNEAQRRFRGRRFDLVIVDEAQGYGGFFADMVFQAIRPALIVKKSKSRKKGENGRLILGGTPGLVPGMGLWEEICAGNYPDWAVHAATCKDNPHVDVESFLEKRAAELGGPQAPIFRREYLRERVPLDGSSGLIYRYEAKYSPPGLTVRSYDNINGSGSTVEGLPGGKWSYMLGVDLGHAVDKSSILVVGVTNAAPGKAWLVEEYLFKRRPLNQVLADEINERILQYHPVMCLCDEGALGVQTADNLRAAPFNLPLMAADKLHPLASSDALNSALANRVLMIPARSRLAQDLTVLRWDPDKMAKGLRVRAKHPHSDLEPPLRYVWPMTAGLLTTVKGLMGPKTAEEKEKEEDARELRELVADRDSPWYRKKGFKRAGRSPLLGRFH